MLLSQNKQFWLFLALKSRTSLDIPMEHCLSSLIY